ncbi:S1 RNA-binding domain-containing protein [Streptomyces sp. NPDC059928]|uniref:S1 RNA-binding domain-containing protein n=1 Tax=unclassified Streptomyces TaxID=2593676 RepID=UPI003656432F
MQTTLGTTLFDGTTGTLAKISRAAGAVEPAQEGGQLLALLVSDLPGELGAVDIPLDRSKHQALQFSRIVPRSDRCHLAEVAVTELSRDALFGTSSRKLEPALRAPTRLTSMSEPAPDPRMQSLINQLWPGAVRTVKVTGFDGADVLVQLVDAGGEEAETGRIPRHEASMRRMEHPSELFEVGQEIDAEEIGRWREGQLQLSARACEIPALRSFLLSLEGGQVVAGTISEVHNFGVFVHVDGEPDGLCTGFIRVPDLTWGWIDHPSEVVEAGQRITAEVIIAETRSGQVTLSLKALQEDPLIRFADQVGWVLTRPTTKIVPFGVFVQLAPDVVGFLHLSELTDQPVETPDQLVDEGELITVRVDEVDLQRHRVRLGAAGGAGRT